VGLFTTPAQAHHYWAWCVDKNGGRPDSRWPSRSWIGSEIIDIAGACGTLIITSVKLPSDDGEVL